MGVEVCMFAIGVWISWVSGGWFAIVDRCMQVYVGVCTDEGGREGSVCMCAQRRTPKNRRRSSQQEEKQPTGGEAAAKK
jgi:hypothetical protein